MSGEGSAAASVPRDPGASDSPGSPLSSLEVLQEGGGHGRGNALYLDRAAGALLKIYRPRRANSQAWREALRSFGHRVFEGKRGTSPLERQRTEAAALRVWAEHGCDAPALIDRTVPREITDPALWIEFCPGRTLDLVLADKGVDPSVAQDHIERLAHDHGRRHRRALDSGESLLIQEHASIVHALASEERLVTFDFENAYREGFPIEVAVCHELAGTLRSFFRRVGGEEGRGFFDQFVAAYPEREILAEAARRAIGGGGLAPRLKRWRDRKRKNRPSKVEVMTWLADAVGRGS